MSMSFQEKSTWVSLVVAILIFGSYFTIAFRELSDPDADNPKIIGFFVIAIVLMVIIEIVLHISLAIAFRKDAEKAADERDNLIELKATRISYFVLAFGVWIASISILMVESLLAMVNIIMFFFVLAEIVGSTTQLLYYRRGV